MSYDFHIKYDDVCSSSIEAKYIIAFLIHLEDINMHSDYSFEFKMSDLNLNAYLYLEYFNEYGDSLELQDTPEPMKNSTKINCIILSIPYVYKHGDSRDQYYIQLGQAIARKLKWKLHDEQIDKYITP